MDKKRRKGVVALLLVIAIGNFLRIGGYDQVKPLYIASLLAIGVLTGILLSDLMHLLRSRKEDKDKLI